MSAALLTPEIRERLLQNGRIGAAYMVKCEATPDFLPVVKFFTPDTELDPEEPDIAFGLCDLGMGCPELGSVRISEIEGVRSKFRPPVERDPSFTPKRTLSAYADEAYERGCILT